MSICIKTLLCSLLLLCLSGTIFADEAIHFPDKEWNYGIIRQGEVLIKEILITNNSKKAITVKIIPTCDCMFSQPENISINPQDSGNVSLIFDTTDYEGEVEKIYIIQTDMKGYERVFYYARGTIKSAATQNREEEKTGKPITDSGQDKKVELFYYYSAGCSHCLSFLNETIPSLEKKLQIDIDVKECDILNPQHFEEYNQKIEQIGAEARAFPSLFIGTTVLQGESEIDKEIENKLLHYISQEEGEEENIESDRKGDSGIEKKNLAIIPVIFAGLLDGINP
ncbi:MAG: DUF1573 domain-containing protein [Spirochaetales bacterium]|nr:DUF1573 domain-containing protein [Spirochaetales bacterium]